MNNNKHTPATFLAELVSAAIIMVVIFAITYYIMPVLSFVTGNGFTTLLDSQNYTIAAGMVCGIFAFSATIALFTKGD